LERQAKSGCSAGAIGAGRFGESSRLTGTATRNQSGYLKAVGIVVPSPGCRKSKSRAAVPEGLSTDVVARQAMTTTRNIRTDNRNQCSEVAASRKAGETAGIGGSSSSRMPM
jgi:hypothetical protein